MSNHLAIATVTATLQRVLQQAVQLSVDGARVTTIRPEGTNGVPETGVNLFLYHIKRNAAWNNADTPGRQRRAEIVKRNQIAIDLYYVLSFYGNEAELEPQRLLGTTLQTLEDQNILTPNLIRDTVSDPSCSYLLHSDLAEQIEMLCTEFVPISTDELSKIWSVFLQTPYVLSIIYKVMVVLIEGEEPGRRALPVRDRRLGFLPFGQQPAIERVTAATGPYTPILRQSILRIQGTMLAAPQVRVRLCGTEIIPSQVSDTEILVSLSALDATHLRAGVQGLQVIHPGTYAVRSTGQPMRSEPYAESTVGSSSATGLITNQLDSIIFRGSESNVAPFVLRPTIQAIQVHDLQGQDDDLRSAEIWVRSDVMVRPGQRTLLLLNERTVNNPAAYFFVRQHILEDAHDLKFKIQAIKPGEYLARLQIDGAESLLQVDMNPNNPTFEQYTQPTLQIS
jgi:hypothetical protein